MCGQHNVRDSAGDITGQNTKDTHPFPGQKLKIPDPAGNLTLAVGLEGRDSTDDATATDNLISSVFINNGYLFALLVSSDFRNEGSIVK